MQSLKEELLDQHDGFIFDLDGVIWLGKEGIPFAKEGIDILRKANKKVLFVTNNASETKEYQKNKLNNLDIECSSEEILNSGYASMLYLEGVGGIKRVYAMGTEQLKEEVVNFGFTHTEENAQAVVVGLDKTFSYHKLDIAFQNLYQKECLLIATNRDAIYPGESCFHPGTGTHVVALEFALSKEADIVIGKPQPTMLKISLDLIGTKPERTIVFGDLLDKDIIWGQRGGLKSCYVLSGVGNEADITRLGIKPDYVSESVGKAFGVC